MTIADLTAYASSGATLNVEERAALSISLPLLKEAQQTAEVAFWGKVQGVQKDYYVAWAGKTVGGSRKWFFSHDAKTWQILPQVGLLEAKAFDVVAAQRFLGDPAYEYEHAVVDGKVQNEEKRLAYTVKKIDQDTAIAPRGAFIQVSSGAIISNPSFNGLPASDAKSLKNWLHFRQDSSRRNSENITTRENVDAAADIFENLEVDQPKGVWSLRSEKGDALVLARHLAWPGSVAYHQQDLNSKPASWGYMYIGQGVKNVDIGFMV